MTRKSLTPNEKLDALGHRIVRASVLSEEDAGAIVDSPFLYTRVRARIAGESEVDDAGSIWAGFWIVSRKAIVAMGLTAAFSFGLYLYTGNKSGNSAFSVDAYLGASDSGIESLVFAERHPLTAEEVFATIVTRDEREPGR